MNQKEKYEERDLAFRAAAKLAETILPIKKFKEVFHESFVFVKQKDIIGGDFFYVHTGEFDIIALIDCTGHSVEGVMTAILIQRYFVDVIQNQNKTDPKEILDHVNSSIQEDYKDFGDHTITADALVLTINRNNMVIQFAGAMRPLQYIDDENNVQFIKGSRVRIGDANYNINHIQKHTLQSRRGAKLYLATDGIETQIGGVDNRKLMFKGFLEWIKEASKIESFQWQKKFFKAKIEEFIGEEDQLDDICLIGIKL